MTRAAPHGLKPRLVLRWPFCLRPERDRALARRVWIFTTLYVLTVALPSAYGYWLASGGALDTTHSEWDFLRWLLGASGCLVAVLVAGHRRWILRLGLSVSLSLVVSAVWLTGVGESWGITDPAHPQSMVDDELETGPDTHWCTMPEGDSRYSRRVRENAIEPGTVSLGRNPGWQVNSSGAFICLDAEEQLPPDLAWLGELRGSYAEFARAVDARGKELIPSVELVQGKSKPIDDGFVAAMSLLLAWKRPSGFTDLAAWLRSASASVDKDSIVYDWAMAALQVGGRLSANETQMLSPRAWGLVARVATEEPKGFYAWSKELGDVYRFHRLLQLRWPSDDPLVIGVEQLLRNRSELRESYARLLRLQSRFANAAALLSFNRDEGVGVAGTDGYRYFLPTVQALETARVEADPNHAMAGFFNAVASGRLDLRPSEHSGFYDYLTYASEPFALPERAEESGRLLYSRAYRRRLRKAFASLQAKHRDTLGLHMPSGEIGIHGYSVEPRLRVEPAMSHFSRMSRAYAGVKAQLEAELPRETLKQVHGLSASGPRALALADELDQIRLLYLGLALVVSRDIGFSPALTDAERSLAAGAEAQAEQWLGSWRVDLDLATDTRTAVQVASNQEGVRVWATLGVRGLLLRTGYQGVVMVRKGAAQDASHGWQEVYDLETREYVLAVDQFAEFAASRVPTRAELQRVAKEQRTPQAIVRELSR